MLFHGAGADVQFLGDFLVAASFHQELQNLFIALRDLDAAEIQHENFLSACFIIESNSIVEYESK
jgi:hypothetical protein